MRLSLSLSLSSFSTTHTVDIPLHLSSGKTVSHQDSGLRVKRLSSFKQNLVSTIDFHENQSPASPVMRTDRQTHMIQLIVAFHNFVNVPNK